MTSTFTWLDYSEAERRKMLDVIDLFGEKTTRDELGLGGVRDAFADLLFSGTTTIQTRAKYFLFVPWMYLDPERKKVPTAKVRGRARDFEIWLAKKLGDAGGAIGKVWQSAMKSSHIWYVSFSEKMRHCSLTTNSRKSASNALCLTAAAKQACVATEALPSSTSFYRSGVMASRRLRINRAKRRAVAGLRV